MQRPRIRPALDRARDELRACRIQRRLLKGKSILLDLGSGLRADVHLTEGVTLYTLNVREMSDEEARQLLLFARYSLVPTTGPRRVAGFVEPSSGAAEFSPVRLPTAARKRQVADTLAAYFRLTDERTP